MSRLHPVVCFAALALTASVAQANPFSLQVLRTRAVPGPHVQISYGVHFTGAWSPVEIPTLAATYGSKQTPWESTNNFRANTGSGVVSLEAAQSCDCFVPKGISLAYETTLPNRISGPARNITLSSSLTVTDYYDAAVPPPPTDGGRWLDPEPMQVQGLDCAVACLRENLDASADLPVALPEDAAGALSDGATLDASTDILMPLAEAGIAPRDALITTIDAPIVSADTRMPLPDAALTMAEAGAAPRDALVAALDAPVVTTPGPDPGKITSKSSKGCSFGGSAPASALPLLGLLALLALGRRRHS